MMKLLKIAGDMVAAFLFGLFLWYAINSTTTRNGVGWLESSQWPLNNQYLSAMILSFVIGGSDVFGLLIGHKRLSETEAAARMIGLDFLSSPDPSQMQVERSLDLFSHWHSLKYAMTGRVQGHNVTVLELVEYYPGSGDDSSPSYPEKTVILLEYAHPTGRQVSITYVGRFSSLINMTGLNIISIRPVYQNDSALADPVVDRFNRKYMTGCQRLAEHLIHGLKPSDQELVEMRQSIESVLSRPLMEMLVSGRGYSMEIGEKQVAVSIDSKRGRKAGLSSIVNESIALFDRISRPVASADRIQAVIEAEPGKELVKQTGRLFGIFALGGIVGMFLAFALFAPLFFLFVEDYPWIVLIWPFFGMAVIIGCITMAFRIASRK